ncbi:hypothetical protein V6S67_07855 [Arthrobacter sp. Soc17.1.1.1]|uniref:hypothetical protein n=1 Tax=Arthrobacter sp. Soc17.1.1.1 TaxID=3121277 RepID=UPI002FE4CCD8
MADPYYNGREDFEKNLRHLISEQTSVKTIAGRINMAPAAGQLASQGDINIVLQQISGLTAAVKALAGNQTAAQVDASIRQAVADVAPSYYVKAEGNPSVYALDVATGTLRPVTFDEFQLVDAADIPLRIVPQSTIDAAPKETR